MLTLASVADFCRDTARIWGIIGYIVLVLKIVIPIALIVLGMIDLGKAVISSDEKAINKSVGTLVKRFVAAVIVFFVPTIVSAVFNLVTSINLSASKYDQCVKCVLEVTSSGVDCTTGISAVEPD